MLDGIAGELNGEQREHLETILRSSNQLRSMIGDLLEATRAESGKISIEPRCLVLGDVIQQAISMMKASAQEKRIGLEAAVDTRIPMVYADPERTLQALLNLLENAIKFTPAEGSVMVKACLVDADHDFAYISVADTGRGITPEARNLIFERLYQDPNSIDDSRKGLGLGLYITRELIRLHGGRIWVESQLGHGTAFTFTLPLFSMAKLLKPVIAVEGKLRDSISLITVELSPLHSSSMGNWDRDCPQCLQLLRSCILRDKDTVLPPFENSSGGELFLVVASTDNFGEAHPRAIGAFPGIENRLCVPDRNHRIAASFAALWGVHRANRSKGCGGHQRSRDRQDSPNRQFQWPCQEHWQFIGNKNQLREDL